VVIETALILLVDGDGALLMQHRDEHATLGPNRWGLPGGRIEPGETPLTAAHRELWEESGLAGMELEPFWTGPRPSEPGVADPITMYAFCGRTEATQRDVVLGEGLEMIFVSADAVLDRDLTVSAALLVPMFLSSTRYARLRGSAAV
jgi:8-oxo-dGTP diphosphatase